MSDSGHNLNRREQSSTTNSNLPSSTLSGQVLKTSTESGLIGHDSSPASQSSGQADKEPSVAEYSPTGQDFVLLEEPNSKPRSSDTFWTENEGTSKGPGRAVMKLSRTVSQPPTTSLQSLVPSIAMSNSSSHKRNHSSSSSKFEDFTKSCNDDWNSEIDQERPGAFTGITRPVNSPPSVSPSEPLPPIGRIMIGPGHPHPASILPAPSTISSNASRILGLASGQSTPTVSNSHPVVPPMDPKLSKLRKLVLEDEVPDMNQVRTLAWSGIPSEVRPITWKLLLGYVPLIKSKRVQVLERKRSEYHHLVHSYYNNKSTNDDMWRQIHIDIPRMQPLISIFQQEVVQKIFERILYIWSIRHPASGYVQGMNDLVTPFFVTYLSEFIPGHSLSDVESFEVSSLPDTILRGVEADSFWCFSKLLDSIQDNYTFAQPGIQRLVNLLSRVMSRVDVNLHDHLTRNSVQYLQFSFRWMNNLLIRELPLRCIVRLWDTYLAEGASTASSNHWSSNNVSSDGSKDSSSGSSSNDAWNASGHGTPFSSSFHLFVCAAFLRFWSKSLMKEQDFQGLMLLLQNLPTFHWTENEIKLMVADAYQLKCTFTPSHLNS